MKKFFSGCKNTNFLPFGDYSAKQKSGRSAKTFLFRYGVYLSWVVAFSLLLYE